jgi:hypothetical protein
MMEDTNGFATGYAVGRDTNGNCGYGNNGMFGNDWFWIVILLLFGYGGFGFGGRGFGGFGSGFGGGCGSPCATQADLAAGFNNSAVLSGINGIDSALCQGFNGINTAILQNGYNTQGAINGLSHQISDCCCATQRAIDGVKYENATNTCAIQNTIQNTTRDIIDNANANSRAILDFLTQDKIATLTAENQSLKFAASQAQQNAFITANQEAQTAELIRRLGRDCPVPAYVVPNPNCCYNANVTFGNGCGCGSF